MTQARELIKELIDKKQLTRAVFSSRRLKTAEGATKTEIRLIEAKGKLLYQLSATIQNKAFHKNLSFEDCLKTINEELLPTYKQALLLTGDADYHLLVSKKGEIKILKKPPSQGKADLSHNRRKNYLIEEGTPLPFLIELGLVNTEGHVYPKKMDKFRQINRFIEMVSDVLFSFEEQKKIHVIDFGCGKAYLTFALYYFLREIKHFDVQMVGLDLKEDVIAYCQEVAHKIGYKGLSFRLGDIIDYAPEGPVDLVVALHACDTATDIALAKAISWKAQAILAAPCCQHELYNQIDSEPLDAILQHGILRERFASVATDAARAQLLEMQGYTTQLLEFIDSAHTPKNLLIRATKGNSEQRRTQAKRTYHAFKELLKIHPFLESQCE